MSEEIARILTEGVPCKDENWYGQWRDFDWDHSGNGCPGWQQTSQSQVFELPSREGTLVALTHCRCACRLHPHVTVALLKDGTRGES